MEELLSPLLSDDAGLRREYRRRKDGYDHKSVHPSEASVWEAEGWAVQRPGKRTTRIKRPKEHSVLLEDRLWCLMYTMGYRVLNGSNFKIGYERGDDSTDWKQVDVYAEDGETVVVTECKSRRERGRRSLRKELQESISLQGKFRNTINKRFRVKTTPKFVWIYATNNIVWSEHDIQRAEDGGIRVVTERELHYFETFIRHLGPAGKYQILGEFLKGQKVPGLADVKLPAIRGKIGGETYYSFVATPRALLKIAFINHQALDHPDGRPAYQRMVSSTRIKKIGTFISKGGFFPTNVLVNFTDTPRFDLISNKENTDPNIKFGWLTLPSKYKSALIIDGQHRLYGFTRLNDAHLDQSLFILAFQRMSSAKEADLFISVNHEQKSVPRSLLVTLMRDIRMGDSDPTTALSALASGVVRQLDRNPSSPLAGRFAVPGMPREARQNLTIPEAVNGLTRSGLIGRRSGKTLVSGPLSGATDENTIERAATVLQAYFDGVRRAHPGRWEAGQEAFISVNPGIRAHLTVIAQAVSYLSHKMNADFLLMKPQEFSQHILEFCKPVFEFINNATDDEVRVKFSRKFGEGGVKEYGYHLMKIVNEVHNDFGTEEFQRWVEQSDSERIDEMNHFLMKLAERLTDCVIDTLKEVHGEHRLQSGEQAFWEIGVESARIRKNAYEAQERDKHRRKPKEAYLNIVDLEEIVKQRNNWIYFEHIFNNPLPGDRRGKRYYTSWIHDFNDLRNIAAHKNQLKTYTDEDIEFVEWLRSEVSPKIPS